LIRPPATATAYTSVLLSMCSSHQASSCTELPQATIPVLLAERLIQACSLSSIYRTAQASSPSRPTGAQDSPHSRNCLSPQSTQLLVPVHGADLRPAHAPASRLLPRAVLPSRACHSSLGHLTSRRTLHTFSRRRAMTTQDTARAAPGAAHAHAPARAAETLRLLHAHSVALSR